MTAAPLTNLSLLSRGVGEVQQCGHEKIEVKLEPEDYNNWLEDSRRVWNVPAILPPIQSSLLPTFHQQNDVELTVPPPTHQNANHQHNRKAHPADHEYSKVYLPKTFTTRKGALLLFSEDFAYKTLQGGHQNTSEKHTVSDSLPELRTVDDLAKSILAYGASKSFSYNREEQTHDGVYLGFVHTRSRKYYERQYKPGFSAKRYLSSWSKLWDYSLLTKITNKGYLKPVPYQKKSDYDVSGIPLPYRILRQWLFAPGTIDGYTFYRQSKYQVAPTREATIIVIDESSPRPVSVESVISQGSIKVTSLLANKELNYGDLDSTTKESILTELLVKSAITHAIKKQKEYQETVSKNLEDEEAKREASAKLYEFDMMHAIQSALDSSVLPKVSMLDFDPQGLIPEENKIKRPKKGFRGAKGVGLHISAAPSSVGSAGSAKVSFESRHRVLPPIAFEEQKASKHVNIGDHVLPIPTGLPRHSGPQSVADEEYTAWRQSALVSEHLAAADDSNNSVLTQSKHSKSLQSLSKINMEDEELQTAIAAIDSSVRDRDSEFNPNASFNNANTEATTTDSNALSAVTHVDANSLLHPNGNNLTRITDDKIEEVVVESSMGAGEVEGRGSNLPSIEEEVVNDEKATQTMDNSTAAKQSTSVVAALSLDEKIESDPKLSEDEKLDSQTKTSNINIPFPTSHVEPAGQDETSGPWQELKSPAEFSGHFAEALESLHLPTGSPAKSISRNKSATSKLNSASLQSGSEERKSKSSGSRLSPVKLTVEAQKEKKVYLITDLVSSNKDKKVLPITSLDKKVYPIVSLELPDVSTGLAKTMSATPRLSFDFSSMDVSAEKDGFRLQAKSANPRPTNLQSAADDFSGELFKPISLTPHSSVVLPSGTSTLPPPSAAGISAAGPASAHRKPSVASIDLLTQVGLEGDHEQDDKKSVISTMSMMSYASRKSRFSGSGFEAPYTKGITARQDPMTDMLKVDMVGGEFDPTAAITSWKYKAEEVEPYVEPVKHEEARIPSRAESTPPPSPVEDEVEPPPADLETPVLPIPTPPFSVPSPAESQLTPSTPYPPTPQAEDSAQITEMEFMEVLTEQAREIAKAVLENNEAGVDLAFDAKTAAELLMSNLPDGGQASTRAPSEAEVDTDEPEETLDGVEINAGLATVGELVKEGLEDLVHKLDEYAMDNSTAAPSTAATPSVPSMHGVTPSIKSSRLSSAQLEAIEAAQSEAGTPSIPSADIKTPSSAAQSQATLISASGTPIKSALSSAKTIVSSKASIPSAGGITPSERQGSVSVQSSVSIQPSVGGEGGGTPAEKHGTPTERMQSAVESETSKKSAASSPKKSAGTVKHESEFVVGKVADKTELQQLYAPVESTTPPKAKPKGGKPTSIVPKPLPKKEPPKKIEKPKVVKKAVKKGGSRKAKAVAAPTSAKSLSSASPAYESPPQPPKEPSPVPEPVEVTPEPEVWKTPEPEEEPDMDFIIVRDEFSDEEAAEEQKPLPIGSVKSLNFGTESPDRSLLESSLYSEEESVTGLSNKDAQAAKRAAAKERRRKEVEKRRREREEAIKKEKEDAERKERIRKQMEDDRLRREEEIRLRKEMEREEEARLEREEQARLKAEKEALEREKRRQEEKQRYMEAQKRRAAAEEERRKELQAQRDAEEQERLRLEQEMLAEMEEEERIAYLRQMEEEERLRKITEEAARVKREEENRRLQEEIARKEAERRRAEEMLRQRLMFQRGLNMEAQGMDHSQDITRAFVFSYYELLKWLGYEIPEWAQFGLVPTNAESQPNDPPPPPQPHP